MVVVVSTKNQVKINALSEILNTYKIFDKTKIITFEINPKDENKPKSLLNAVLAAKNKAFDAYCYEQSQDSLGVCIEDCLVDTALVDMGEIDVCICAVYNGTDFALGLSHMFEYSPEIIDIILKEHSDIGEIFLSLPMPQLKKNIVKVGATEFLTGKGLCKNDYTKRAILTALLQLENIKIN